MDLLSQTDNSLEMLQTAGGFKTSLFGFSRSEVLEYIDRLMMQNASRNKQLNSSLVEMEGRLCELEEENETLLEKTKVLVDQLSDAHGSTANSEKIEALNVVISDLNAQNDSLRYKVEEQQELIDALNHQINTSEQASKILSAENDTLKSQIQKLEESLEEANETSKYADETIVAAQRAASKIMTEAVKQVPKKEEPVINLTLLRDNILELEKQLHTVAETVEFAVTGNAEQGREETPKGVVKHFSGKERPNVGGGWISANAPNGVETKSVSSFWHPSERPSAPTGWQQPPKYVAKKEVPLALQKKQEHEVYYHRKEERSSAELARKRVVRPNYINYRDMKSDDSSARIYLRRKR